MTVASITEFLDFMPDQIGLEVWTGADAFGAPTYAASVSYPAYIEGKTRMVRNLQGEDQVSMVRVYIGGIPGIKGEDRITLPARFAPATQPAIISVNKVSDEAGPHHEEVDC